MSKAESVTAFKNLRDHIGFIIDEIETNGIKCNVGVHIALMNAWNNLGYTD